MQFCLLSTDAADDHDHNVAVVVVFFLYSSDLICLGTCAFGCVCVGLLGILSLGFDWKQLVLCFLALNQNFLGVFSKHN